MSSAQQYDGSELWMKVCVELQNTLSPGVFNTWILPNSLSLVEEKETGLECTIEAPTVFHISILEKNFKHPIEEAIKKITQTDPTVYFKVGSFTANTKNSTPKSTSKSTSIKSDSLAVPASPTVTSLFSESTFAQAEEDMFEHKLRNAGLNKNYIFETFAVSSTNEMAHAAAVAVSQNPGKAYNVLFLYGGVGVGKTHLMQAVGQNILKNNIDTTLLYRTGEEFMNEIVGAIQTKKTLQMKQKYRSVQVLLIDDIQFMAGKHSMQEEFFHTFNAVIKAGGQVILTSDRPPHEIHPLDDRIQSRLEGGLIIDIQQPSFELRTAIVLIKAKQISFPLPMDLAQKIASAITSTRRLEGIVKALHSEHILRHQPITAELVDSILKKHLVEEVKITKIKAKPIDIIKITANHFHIKLIDIRGPKRQKPIADARHLAMFLLKQELNIPLIEIGQYFGGRDHTSVLHAVKKIGNRVSVDDDLRTQLQAIKTSLQSTSM